MARKGVNLLEGDDDEREGDSEGDSGDDGGSYERRRGGFVDVLMVILFVCVMLGGVAWAGYQFWWLPKVKNEAQLKRARIKQEQQRKMRLEKMRAAAERAQQTPAAPGQFRQTKRPQEQKREFGASERPAPSRPVVKPKTLAAAMMKKEAAPRKPAKEPAREMVMAVKTPEKIAPPKTVQPSRPSPMKKQAAGEKTEKAKTKIRDGAGVRKSPQGFYYSVQVASCSTDRCADSFLKRLRNKGYSALRAASTSRARRRSGQITEVRLGSFSSLDEARTLASRARKKKIGTRVYRSNNQWRVAAGSFSNLEDAALLLDRAEDSGFRGELASRLQSSGTRRLYTIRTGKFASLREALAFRKKIRLAGFSDAIVVRRRLRK